MLFQPDHIDMIRNGRKTATRRRWKRPHAKVNGTYPVQSRMYQPRRECPIIKALMVYRQRLGDMTEEDALKEGGYTLEQYRSLWEKINTTVWDDREVVYVIEFNFLCDSKQEEDEHAKH